MNDPFGSLVGPVYSGRTTVWFNFNLNENEVRREGSCGSSPPDAPIPSANVRNPKSLERVLVVKPAKHLDPSTGD